MSATPVANAATESDELLRTSGPNGKASQGPADGIASANEGQDSPQGTQVKITLSAEEAASLDELCAKEGITAKAAMFRRLLIQAVDSASRSEQSSNVPNYNLLAGIGAGDISATEATADLSMPKEQAESLAAKAEDLAVQQLAAEMVQKVRAHIADNDD